MGIDYKVIKETWGLGNYLLLTHGLKKLGPEGYRLSQGNYRLFGLEWLNSSEILWGICSDRRKEAFAKVD